MSFYNTTKWKELRLLKLQMNPLCEHCLRENKITPATEVDHIIPIQQRPDLALDINNLQSLCKPCHSRKTAQETNQKKQGQIINRKYKGGV